MARVGASSSATSTRLGICSGLATLDGLNTEKTVPPDHRWSCCEARERASGGALFTGCSAYPGCAFSEPHDPRVQTLSTGVVQAIHALATQMVQVQTEARRQVAQAQADAQRQVVAERATLDRTVRQLIACVGPSRPLAGHAAGTRADRSPGGAARDTAAWGAGSATLDRTAPVQAGATWQYKEQSSHTVLIRFIRVEICWKSYMPSSH